MSEYTSWHVGMKVVCLPRRGGRWSCVNSHPRAPFTLLPETGRVYEIAELCFDEEEQLLYITLVGLDPDALFEAPAFRPVQKRKTDISVFTALLNTTKEREPA